MERNLIQCKSDSENHSDFRCGECGEEFSKPLLARMSSQGLVQTYYACPRCLTKVPEARSSKSERSEAEILSVHMKKSPAKLEPEANCHHFFGYLRKRAKDSSIPEDCLTCERMIECMVH
jgi:DNA-directed RNA polymerase subunit RPC12/RpoP